LFYLFYYFLEILPLKFKLENALKPNLNTESQAIPLGQLCVEEHTFAQALCFPTLSVSSGKLVTFPSNLVAIQVPESSNKLWLPFDDCLPPYNNCELSTRILVFLGKHRRGKENYCLLSHLEHLPSWPVCLLTWPINVFGCGFDKTWPE